MGKTAGLVAWSLLLVTATFAVAEDPLYGTQLGARLDRIEARLDRLERAATPGKAPEDWPAILKELAPPRDPSSASTEVKVAHAEWLHAWMEANFRLLPGLRLMQEQAKTVAGMGDAAEKAERDLRDKVAQIRDLKKKYEDAASAK